MRARGSIQSPVLVGRDSFLALIEDRLAAAAAGEGRLLFVAGEAGIGKTRLLSAVARRADAGGFAVVRAAAFPDDVQSLAGLLLDLAGNLLPAREPALSELGRSLTSRVRAISAAAGDAHHRRRVLVQDLADLLVTADPGTPVLIILEDLHWADELSLDVLGHLAGRLATRPLLVTGAYRSDELYPRLPMRDLRARLLGQRLTEEIRLPRLGLAQTAAMTSALLGRPAPAQMVQAIHERSDGIPLHVEELLAAIDEDTLTPQSGAAIQAATVPDTLGDAVLSRVRHLAANTRDVASAAAVIGRSFDFDLLTVVTGHDPDEVAGALRQLQDAYLVLPGANEVTFDFRHALIRDTLYADTDLPTRRRLHERVARAAVDRGYRGAFISAHFEQAQCGGLAHEYAVAAAGEAASVSAHGEALELYRRAVRNLPGELPAPERAGLFAALGDEAAATDDNTAAAQAYRTAHELMASAGDARAAAALVPRMVAVAHLLGENLPVRVGLLQAALDSLDGVAGADRERARLGSAMAAAYLVDDRLDEAIAYGEASRAESQRLGDEEAALNTAATLGSVLVFAGRMEEGWRLLEDAIARATGAQQEAEAARGYRMIGSSASALVEYDLAERWLAGGHRLRRKGRAVESPALHGFAPRARPVGHRPVAGGRPDRAAGPGRRARRHHHPDHRAVRPGLPGAWDAATGPSPPTCWARPSVTVTGWPNCSGSRRRCGAWPKRPGARVITTPRSGTASVATRLQPTSPTPATSTRTCSPASGPTWPVATSTPRRPGRTGSARCSPSAPSRAPCLRSATPGDCSCSPGARCPRRIRNCRRPASRGRSCAGSGKARGPGSTSRRRPPGRAAAARRPCSPTRSAPSPPRPAPPFSPRPPIGSADHLTRPSRPSRGIR